MSSRYRKVDMGTWTDQRFCGLSAPPPCGQFLWLFLLTGKYSTNVPGVVLARPAEVAASLGWPTEGLAQAFAEGFAKGLPKASAKDDWRVVEAFREVFAGSARPLALASTLGLIWLPRAPKYNRPESPNVVRSWRATWELVPECSLKAEIWRALETFTESLGEGYAKAFREALAHPIANQEQEQEQEQDSYRRGAGVPPALPAQGGEFKLAPSEPPKPKRKPRPKPEPVAGHREFVAGFDELFRERRGGEPPTWGGKQGALVKQLLKRAGPDVVLERARRMFALAPRFPAENPDLATLVAHWDKFAPLPAGSAVGATRVDADRRYAGGEVKL